MTSRRDFLHLLGAAALAGCGTGTPQPVPPGKFLGPTPERAHRQLGDREFKPDRTLRTNIAIVGAGIGGLSTAWKLAAATVDDFLLLDMEQEAGGNSRSGQSPVCAYPLAAHYLPLPSPQARYVRELLAECGVLHGPADALKPHYDERFLCASPQERVFHNGLWHDGLLPHLGLTQSALAEQSRFQAQMEAFKQLRGADGRPVFALPMALSSRDPRWLALDRQSFKTWLDEAGYREPSVHWLANYACRDDYGCAYQHTSAWAGLHYFVCRTGQAANASSDTVLTAPEGNAWLVRALARGLGQRLLTDSQVLRVSDNKHTLTVDVRQAERDLRIEARYLIWAAPLFLLPHLAPWLPTPILNAAGAADYAPWLTANLHLDGPPQERRGAPPAWDNVLYDSPGLGYVIATHQQIRRQPGASVFTYYRALHDLSPQAGRQQLLSRSREDWANEILDELSRVHPDIRQRTTQVDLFRHGHAMRMPRPDSLWDGRRQALADYATPRLTFAHADLSGFSLFEEAQYRGVIAASRALRAFGKALPQ